jgi:methyl-accepting chemotaxis protein
MTTERWDDDRLDRLANTVESNNRMIEALGNRVDSIAIATESNNRLIEALGNRVDSIAIATESNNRLIEALGNRVDSIAIATENNHRLIESNARVIQALANASAEAREEREQLFQKMDRQQEEIVGLRIETRRMLDILINQRNQGDNPTD